MSTVIADSLQFTASDFPSLYSAINSINQNGPGGTITITGSFQLTEPLPPLCVSMTLIGTQTESPYCTITGNPNQGAPMFNVTAGVATFQYLELSGGTAFGLAGGSSDPNCGVGGGGGGGLGAGGAIMVQPGAGLTVESVCFSNNTAQGGVGGAALNATGYPGSGGFGGGLNTTNYLCGQPGTTQWDGNGTDGTGGGALGAGGGGGGGGSSPCTGGDGGPGAFGGGGGGAGGGECDEGGEGGAGGAFAGGGGDGDVDGGGGGGGAGLGGAIFIQAGAGPIQLSNVTASGNTVAGGGGGGAASLGASGTAGAGAGSLLYCQGNVGATLEFDTDTTLDSTETFASDGGGMLTKTGLGTLVLDAPAPFQGNVGITISAGAIEATGGGNAVLGYGSVAVQAGTTLVTSGTLANALWVAGTVSIPAGQTVTFNGGGLSLAPGATLQAGGPVTTDVLIQQASFDVPSNVTVVIDQVAGPGLYQLIGSTSPVTNTGNLGSWVMEMPSGFGAFAIYNSMGIALDVFQTNGAGNYGVTSAGEAGPGTLLDAICWANAGLISSITIAPALQITIGSQLFVNTNLSIDGQGASISTGNVDRIFFIAGGTVTLANLTLAGARATGGNGANYKSPISGGGGGGAGLGGAIFVANGVGIPQSNVTLPTHVSLQSIRFINNSTVGGAGWLFTGDSTCFLGGGGGMGGHGVNGGIQGSSQYGLVGMGTGGGGGFGNGANGGVPSYLSVFPQSQGIPGMFIGGNAGGNGEGTIGGQGGINGGGGGGAETQLATVTYGGGGGVGGLAGTQGNPGSGGFGGGGAGGGNGGFGGGGGCGGNGGFGGGGGDQGGVGGFGGGEGPGGGLGAGGALFVQLGATVTIDSCLFSGNTVTGGFGLGPGDQNGGGFAIGADVFLGATVNVNVPTNATCGIPGGFGGGAGDPNHPDDPNAQGGFTLTGGGQLYLPTACTHVGPTTIQEGQLYVTGACTSSPTTVQAGGVVSGTGPMGTVQLNAGGTLLPGGGTPIGANAIPGTLVTQNQVWQGGANYNWLLTDATGAAGVGYSTLVVNGALDLSQVTPTTPVAINLWTLSCTNPLQSGAADNFDNTQAQTWTLATAGTINGWQAGLFTVVASPANGTGGFCNAFAGTFAVACSGSSLVLQYTPPT